MGIDIDDLSSGLDGLRSGVLASVKTLKSELEQERRSTREKLEQAAREFEK